MSSVPRKGEKMISFTKGVVSYDPNSGDVSEWLVSYSGKPIRPPRNGEKVLGMGTDYKGSFIALYYEYKHGDLKPQVYTNNPEGFNLRGEILNRVDFHLFRDILAEGRREFS